MKLKSIIVYYGLTPDNMKKFPGTSKPLIKNNFSEYDIKNSFGDPYKFTTDGFTKELYYIFDDHYCIFIIAADNKSLCYAEIKEK